MCCKETRFAQSQCDLDSADSFNQCDDGEDCGDTGDCSRCVRALLREDSFGCHRMKLFNLIGLFLPCE